MAVMKAVAKMRVVFCGGCCGILALLAETFAGKLWKRCSDVLIVNDSVDVPKCYRSQKLLRMMMTSWTWGHVHPPARLRV